MSVSLLSELNNSNLNQINNMNSRNTTFYRNKREESNYFLNESNSNKLIINQITPANIKP